MGPDEADGRPGDTDGNAAVSFCRIRFSSCSFVSSSRWRRTMTCSGGGAFHWRAGGVTGRISLKEGTAAPRPAFPARAYGGWHASPSTYYARTRSSSCCDKPNTSSCQMKKPFLQVVCLHSCNEIEQSVKHTLSSYYQFSNDEHP